MSLEWLETINMLTISELVVAASLQRRESRGSHWRSDYEAARREATEKKRPLFIVFAAEGCGWCRLLEATTLREPQVIRLLNDRFVPVRVFAEEEQGQSLVPVFHVRAFPTIVVIAPNGALVCFLEGYQGPPSLVHALRLALSPGRH